MGGSAKTFIALTLGTLFTLISVWFLLVQKSRSSEFEPPLADHALLQRLEADWLLVIRGPQALSPADWPPESVGVWLDFRVSSDGELILIQDATRPDANGLAKPIGLISSRDPELQGFPRWSELVTTLSQSPRLVVLHALENREGVDLAVLAALAASPDLSSKIILSAESEGLLRDLRKQSPRSVFAASHSSLTRLQTAASLSLEGLIGAPGDIFLVPTRILGDRRIDLLSESLLREANRRSRRVFAAWPSPFLNSKGRAELADSLGVRGLIVSDLTGICASLETVGLEQRIGYCAGEKR
jgi:hypothetical protein